MLNYNKRTPYMKDTILEFFGIYTSQINTATDLIIGLIKQRHVSSSLLAEYQEGNCKVESKRRKIERFFQHIMDPEALLAVCVKLLGKRKFILSIDRTNWKSGSTDINAFGGIAHTKDGVGCAIALEMLDNKGGSSDTEARIKLIKSALAIVDVKRMEAMLADREFFSFEFAAWLIENNIPFVIRLKENLSFVQPYLSIPNRTEHTFKQVVIGEHNGIEIECDLSVKKVEKEWLIAISHRVRKPLAEYRKRWNIEVFFKHLKTAGFNLERTKITHNKRFEILFLLCAIACIFCTRIGIYRHKHFQKIRRKKDGYNEFSYFRWGLNWIITCAEQSAQQLIDSITLIFPEVQP